MAEPTIDIGIPGVTDAEKIGSGGFASVYRAFQPAFDRFVAVKVLNTPAVDDASRGSFERECRAIGRLQGHPNIVTVHAAGTSSFGLPYLIMAYLPHGSLADRLRQARVPWPDAVDIAAKLATALHFAHEHDILHRDVKPGNVLLTDRDEPQLADFGIARLAQATQTQGHAAFTPAHVPPEFFVGRPPTPAYDIYSLASTLFELIAGRPAFVELDDEDRNAVIYRVGTAPVPDLLRPQGVPEAVCQAIETAMAKEPSDRPASAAVFAAQLLSARRIGMDVRTTRAAVTEQSRSSGALARRPWPKWVLLGAVFVAGALVLAFAVMLPAEKPAKTPTSAIAPPASGARTSNSEQASAAVSTSSPTSQGQSTVPAVGPTLGHEVLPVVQEPCRTPNFANGSAWEVGPVQVNRQSYQTAYFCNVFSAGVGTLDFVLGKSYRALSLTIGFADDSTSFTHAVKFELIGDGSNYLAAPETLRFGQTAHLTANVSGTSRLTLKITEVSPPGGNDAASKVVWANPVLTAAP